MLENAKNPGFSAPLQAVVKELQGLTLALVTGAAAGTRMDVPGLDDDDTIISAIHRDNTGAPTEDKANITMNSRKASGTITVGSPVADDTVVVQGVTYTLKASANVRSGYRDVVIGTANETAANLAKVINEAERARATGPLLIAAAVNNVVTVTAAAKGTGGNAYTLAETGGSFTISGANLTGGDANGGFTSTTNLSGKTVELLFYKKGN